MLKLNTLRTYNHRKNELEELLSFRSLGRSQWATDKFLGGSSRLTKSGKHHANGTVWIGLVKRCTSPYSWGTGSSPGTGSLCISRSTSSHRSIQCSCSAEMETGTNCSRTTLIQDLVQSKVLVNSINLLSNSCFMVVACSMHALGKWDVTWANFSQQKLKILHNLQYRVGMGVISVQWLIFSKFTHFLHRDLGVKLYP